MLLIDPWAVAFFSLIHVVGIQALGFTVLEFSQMQNRSKLGTQYLKIWETYKNQAAMQGQQWVRQAY